MLGEGIGEIKCPYNLRDETSFRSNPPQFMCVTDGKLTLKMSDDYYYQVQGQLAVTKKIIATLLDTPNMTYMSKESPLTKRIGKK